LDDLVATRGAPKVLRVDHGRKFLAHALSEFCDELGVTLWCTIPGSPWQGGKVESFNGRLRDEMFNGELFESVTEAQILLDHWHVEDNEYRPHSSLGYLSPKEFVALPMAKQRQQLRTATQRPRAWWEVRELREETIAA
jgi:putative transposase